MATKPDSGRCERCGHFADSYFEWAPGHLAGLICDCCIKKIWADRPCPTCALDPECGAVVDPDQPHFICTACDYVVCLYCVGHDVDGQPYHQECINRLWDKYGGPYDLDVIGT